MKSTHVTQMLCVKLLLHFDTFWCSEPPSYTENKGKKRKQDPDFTQGQEKEQKIEEERVSRLTSLRQVEGAAIAGDGGLSEESLLFLDLLDDPSSSQPRQASDFVLDPLTCGKTVKTRNPDLALVFGNQSELDYWRICTEFRLSTFNSNRLLKAVTKVRFLFLLAVYCVCSLY